MKIIRKSGLAALLFGLAATAAVAGSNPIEGRWDATLETSKATIPFRLDISGDGASLKGTLYNGDQRNIPPARRFRTAWLCWIWRTT
jgi:hypothetical protein